MSAQRVPDVAPAWTPYREALRAYSVRKRAALAACIDAGLPLLSLVGKCAMELELMAERARCGIGPAPAGEQKGEQRSLWWIA